MLEVGVVCIAVQSQIELLPFMSKLKIFVSQGNMWLQMVCNLQKWIVVEYRYTSQGLLHVPSYGFKINNHHGQWSIVLNDIMRWYIKVS